MLFRGFGNKQNRKLFRKKMVVPVRIYVQDDSGTQLALLAHTLDANTTGARIGGFHGQVSTGQVVTVQYQHRRSSFRVIWTGKRGTAQGTQLGLECLEPGKNVWNLETPENDASSATPKPIGSAIEVRWSLGDV
jgi:hypothetical protein